MSIDIEAKGDRKVLFQAKKSQLGMARLAIHYACLGIGTGIMQLGYTFKCGAALAELTNTFFAVVNYLSLHLLTKVLVKANDESISYVFKTKVSRSVYLLFLIVVSSTMIFPQSFYLIFIIDSCKALLGRINITETLGWADPIALVMYLFLLLVFPTLCIKNMKVFNVIVMIKFLMIVLLGIVICVEFGKKINTYGFDPKKQIKFFDVSYDWSEAILAFSTAYLIQPIASPGIDSLKNGTERSIKQTFALTILIQWLFYTVFGLIEYFTFFSDNIKGVILSLYNPSPIITFAYLALIVIMIISINMTINPPRYEILKCFGNGNHVPKETYIFMGVIIQFTAISMSIASQSLQRIIGIVVELSGPINSYLIPSLMYIWTSWKDSKVLSCIAIFIVIVGLSNLGILLFHYISG